MVDINNLHNLRNVIKLQWLNFNIRYLVFA